MEKRKWSFWDFLAWVSIGYITLWLILKVTGVINTPILLEYSPLFGAVYLTGHLVSKLMRATEDISEVKTNVKVLESKVIEMDKDLHFIKKNIESR